ncbi:MAG: NAD(P)/FAD-dependent oxidoreductase [Oscillospiraceae bacterium]|nr:NAD(P)/FAD-dependent oxidoreductase [Oscillospiraceae bacterium]
MSDVIVIGGGAAGMMAAITAARRGKSVVLLEKNDRLGRKLAITGKGRCNVTNNCEIEELMSNIPRNAKFLYGAMTKFPPSETMAFFEGLGVQLKTERGKRVFPVSDKAGDIVAALEKELRRLGVKILRENARSLILENGVCKGVRTAGGDFSANSVILAAGGKSYPKTGSDGSGYALARQAGHTIIEPVPSLVPMVTEEKWVKSACGLTLKNTAVKLFDGEKSIYEDFGEVAFTADGLGGATILSASAHIPEMREKRYSVALDLKPALSEQKLDARLLREFSDNRGKPFREVLRKLLPAELVEIFADLAGISLEKKIDEITKSERKNLLNLLKNLRLHISGFRPIDEAIITRGGVKTSEISPKTMESRVAKGLFFAGEIIDADAYTGGFNLQIAFATAKIAGESA